MIPLASRTNELAPSAPTTHRALMVRVSPVRASRPGSGDPPKRELNPVVGLDESLGGPSALDGHSRRDARMAVDRSLELRLEEHVIALPPDGAGLRGSNRRSNSPSAPNQR